MASLNEVKLIGNLGRDPEYRVTANGASQASISIATTRKWRGKESEPNEWQSETEWHRVMFFGRLAEVARDFLK